MQKHDLLERARALWPGSISLGSALVADGVVHAIPILNSIYQPIEAELDRSDTWLVVSAWSFQQALYQTACDALGRGERELAITSVSLELFDEKMQANLCDPSCCDEQAAYAELG